MLAAHDAVTINSWKNQHKLGKLVHQGRQAAHTASLDQLPETERPPGPDDPLGGREIKPLAKARYRSLQGAAATVCPYAANGLATGHVRNKVRGQ